MSKQFKGRAPKRLAVGIVGAGAVGAALARRLLELKLEVRVWSRLGIQGTELERKGAREVRALKEMAESTQVVVFAVSDSALADVAADFAACLPEEKERSAPDSGGILSVALHTAGALGPEVLDAIKQKGWSCAQMHPMAAVRVGDPIPAGTFWGISGDEHAVDLSSNLVKALGDEVLRLSCGQSLRYHLAANLVAGGAVALMDMALEIMQGVGGREVARRALAALLATTAKNLKSDPTQHALTGPQVRGEVDIVRAHLAALDELDPRLGEVYRLLARRMLTLASIEEQDLGDSHRELEQLLQEP